MIKRDKPYGRQIRTFDTVFSEVEPSGQPSQSLPLNAIQVSSLQPRRYFDPQKMEQLVQSVKEHGILEPLLVRSLGNDQYELVAGERRFRAAKELGLQEVPVVIREFSDQEAREIALVENLQREDLNPVEETEGILQLLSIRLKVPVEEVSTLLYRMQKEAKGKTAHNVVGRSEFETVEEVFAALGLLSWESFVNHRIPLLNLPEEILEALRQGQIEYTKAQAIARIKDAAQRKEVLEKAINQNLSLSEIKSRIQELKSSVQAEVKPEQALVVRMTDIARRLKTSKAWSERRKRDRINKLLDELDRLASDE